MSDLNAIIGKALSDLEFCEQLITDPEGVLRDHGVPVIPELIDTIRRLDVTAVRRLAAAFGREQAAG